MPLGLLKVLAPYLAGAAIVLGVAWGIHSYGESRYRAGVAVGDATIAKLRADQLEAHAALDASYRARETVARAAQQEALDHAHAQALADRAAAVAAGAAADRLRQRAAALASACTGPPAADRPATPGSAPATDAGDLLAHMLGRADEVAGLFARIADERGTAGMLCERSYDAVSAK